MICECDKLHFDEHEKAFSQAGEKSRIPAVNSLISQTEKQNERFLSRLAETLTDELTRSSTKVFEGFEFMQILAAFYEEYVRLNYKPMFMGSMDISLSQFVEEVLKQGGTTDPLKFDFDQLFLKIITNNGLEAVKRITIKENEEVIREILLQSTRDNLGMEEINRAIRKQIPERIWVYNRLIRSEIAIAYDSATIQQARHDGIQHVQYKASLRPCPICLPFSNLIWKTGENPRITYDTHPHCLCHIIPKVYLRPGATVQPKFISTMPEFAYPSI